jgi:hypothetical protein
MATCGVLTFRGDITGYAQQPLECLRPDGHTGPHLIQREDGTYIAYEIDWECDCDYCHSSDREEWCELYKPVSEIEANVLVAKWKYHFSYW